MLFSAYVGVGLYTASRTVHITSYGVYVYCAGEYPGCWTADVAASAFFAAYTGSVNGRDLAEVTIDDMGTSHWNVTSVTASPPFSCGPPDRSLPFPIPFGGESDFHVVVTLPSNGGNYYLLLNVTIANATLVS